MPTRTRFFEHYRKADRIMLALVWLMFLFSLGLAFWHDTLMQAIIVGGSTSVVLTLLYRAIGGSRVMRCALGAGLMVMAALHINQAQGVIESHFGIFALLAVLTFYRDWLPILLAASTVLTEDLLPRLRGGKQSSLGVNRLFTLLTGIAVLGIALVVNDVISALTLAYNLLVGGMLIPLIGAIFWKRATTSGAITSMTLGFVTALVFMIKDGLDANTPIYYSLAVGLVSFVVVSLLSRRPAGVAASAV
jgi:Na+/pantothenate symporter